MPGMNPSLYRIPIIWLGPLASEPSNPQLGWFYYNTTSMKAYLYNGTSWDLVSDSSATAFTGRSSSTGTISGGAVSRNSGLTIDIAAVSVQIFYNGSLTQYDLGATTGWSVPANAFTIVVVDETGNLANKTEANYSHDSHATLALVATDATSILYIMDYPVHVENVRGSDHEWKELIYPFMISGGVASIYSPPSLQIGVTSGRYYMSDELKDISGATPITFTYWYRSGGGYWKFIPDQTSLNASQYDDGSGTLASIPTEYYKKDVIYAVPHSGTTEFHVLMAQETFPGLVQAKYTKIYGAPEFLKVHAFELAGAVLLQGETSISAIIDQRGTGRKANYIHSHVQEELEGYHPQNVKLEFRGILKNEQQYADIAYQISTADNPYIVPSDGRLQGYTFESTYVQNQGLAHFRVNGVVKATWIVYSTSPNFAVQSYDLNIPVLKGDAIDIIFQSASAADRFDNPLIFIYLN